MDKNVTVLVVEDILSARETVVHILRALGFTRFQEAENGVQALEALKANDIGLIISDWNMPQMNGLALLRKVRAQVETSHVPFIFLTSKSEVEDVALASDQGVSGYLIKPVTIKAMAEVLIKIFEHGFEKQLDLLRTEIRNLCADKNYDRVHQLLTEFERLHPSQIFRIRLERVRLLMDVGDYARAEELMCEILAANPLFSKGWETMAEIFHSFNMRSQRQSLFAMKCQNLYLWGAAALSLVLTLVVLYVPFLQQAFSFEHISFLEYGIALALAFMIIPLVEIVKAIQRAVTKRK